MTVKELRELLETALETLEGYEDEKEIKLESNTYFLGHPNAFIGIAGYNGGYLALDWLDETLEKNDEDEEEDL